jgi:uncharacterized protein (DUF58 family)
VSRVRHSLKRLIGRIVMKASYWTAFGAMLIPVGVAVLLGMAGLHGLAFWLIVVGFISFGVGWSYTIKEERRQDEVEKRRQREEERRQKEHEVRLRGEKATFLLLTYMAEKLGIDLTEFAKAEEKFLDGE